MSTYKVGGPDPTPDDDSDDEPPCSATNEDGFYCTWNADHVGPHVAGTGDHIAALWS